MVLELQKQKQNKMKNPLTFSRWKGCHVSLQVLGIQKTGIVLALPEPTVSLERTGMAGQYQGCDGEGQRATCLSSERNAYLSSGSMSRGGDFQPYPTE